MYIISFRTCSYLFLTVFLQSPLFFLYYFAGKNWQATVYDQHQEVLSYGGSSLPGGLHVQRHEGTSRGVRQKLHCPRRRLGPVLPIRRRRLRLHRRLPCGLMTCWLGHCSAAVCCFATMPFCAPCPMCWHAISALHSPVCWVLVTPLVCHCVCGFYSPAAKLKCCKAMCIMSKVAVSIPYVCAMSN